MILIREAKKRGRQIEVTNITARKAPSVAFHAVLSDRSNYADAVLSD
jgi:hypothetical protein